MTISEFVAVGRRPAADGNEAGMVDWLRHAAETVAERDWPAVGKRIADRFPDFATASLRNAAALALADMRYPEIETVLNEALTRQSIALTGGTLLYALDETNSRVTHPVIRNIVSRGSYEARAELMILLEKGLVVQTSGEDARLTAELLRAIAGGADADAAEAAEIALDLLSVA